MKTVTPVRSSWIRHGLLNTLEHGVTRVADAASSLVLLWVFTPELFSKLALSQAMVAPVLLLFVSPENVIYRDFAVWRAQGVNQLAGRLHAFRLFGWGKIPVAVLFSAGFATFAPGEGRWENRAVSLLWAFSLALAPQIAGIDREFLRMDLRLSELNWVNIYQKVSLLAATVFCALVFPSNLGALALCTWASAFTAAAFAFWHVRRVLREMGADAEAIRGSAGPPVVATLIDSLKGFSLAQHAAGVIQNWVQTLSLFFMGVLRYPAREVGLFAAVLKLSGLSIAMPMALSSVVHIWLARRELGGADELARERSKIGRVTGILVGACAVQGAMLAALAPWILHLLSRGKWTEQEQAQMAHWFRWLVSGAAFFGALYPLYSWAMVRTPIFGFLSRVFVPWLAIAALLYVGVLSSGGSGASALGAAQVNFAVCLIYVALLTLYVRREGRR